MGRRGVYHIGSMNCPRAVARHVCQHSSYCDKRCAKALQPPTCHVPRSGIRRSSKYARTKERGGHSNSFRSTIGDFYSLSSTLPPVSFAIGWQGVYEFKKDPQSVSERNRRIGQVMSPKRSTLFAQNLENYEGGVTLKSLCPTVRKSG